MKISNEVVKYNDKYYARISYVIGDTIPPKSICKFPGSSTYCNYNMSYDVPTKVLSSDADCAIYIPITVPKGYPTFWEVLKDKDVIDSYTLFYYCDELNNVHEDFFGIYSNVMNNNPAIYSCLMFNPVFTPISNFKRAEDSGVITEWKAGKEIQYSIDGEHWIDIDIPDFTKNHKWRVKPITPPVFDWQSIVKGKEPKGLVLVMNYMNPLDICTASFSKDEWVDSSDRLLFPTHYTTLVQK